MLADVGSGSVVPFSSGPDRADYSYIYSRKETSLLYTGRVSYASLESVHWGAGGCHRVSPEVLLMLLRNFSLAYRTVWYTERMDPTRPVSRPGPGIDIVLDP
jgi:hypothetical protein